MKNIRNEELPDRMKNIRNECDAFRKTHAEFKDDWGKFLVFEPLKLAYCVVAKAGCTQWIRIFRVLHNATKSNVHDPNEITKWDTHFMDKGTMVHNTMKTNGSFLQHAFKFMISRDPYTRLLSGYIDMVYLPNMWRTIGRYVRANYSTNALRNYSDCGSGLSFNQFLKYVIHSEDTGIYRNGHWTPIYRLCNPCIINFTYVAKQETFEKDLQHIKSKINLEKYITNSKSTNYAEKEMTDQIHYFFRLNRFDSCLPMNKLFVLLWKSFQIRGFISPDTSFREDRSLNSYETFLSHVLNIHRRENPSSEEVHQRRKSYLMAAYALVPRRIVKEIRRIYSWDFRIFGYDPEPAFIFG